MGKTNKAVLKRIKVTATGKLLRRASRQNHFNAKARSINQSRRKASRGITGAVERQFRRLIGGRQ